MKIFEELIGELAGIETVEGILLGGSRVTGNYDENSDFDVYVYSSTEIDLSKRKEILDKYLEYYELNNTLWECEDAGFFKGNRVQIDIIYRSLNDIDNHLNLLINGCNVSTGYSTCIWSNFVNSKVLFDRNGDVEKIRGKYDVEYSDNLVEAIIAKNFGVLSTIIPAYSNQISKAIKRKDLLSINHRLTAFFESYFDIIFAINKQKHPGEKKLIKILKAQNYDLPEEFEENINKILLNQYTDTKLAEKIKVLVEKLKELIIKKGYKI